MQPTRLVLAMALAASQAAYAAAPTSGAYVTDPQNEWVQERLSEVISTPNMIMCFMSALRAGDMVNQGNYIALVDMEKCDSSKRGQDNSSSTSAGSSANVNYTRVTVNSSRTSNSDPQTGKVWFTMGMGGGQNMDMYVQATLNESPSSSNPNGRFTVSFCGVLAGTSPGTCTMQGTLDASGTAISFTEAGPKFGGGTYATQLTMDRASDGTSGSGRVRTTDGAGADGAFAFNATHFKRGNSSGNACFSRDRTNADFSTWRYGVYNSNGSRLEVSNPGFPITASYNSQNYGGYAGFWGVFLPTDVLNNVTEVQRMTPGSNATTTYTLTKAGGKLYKMTKSAGTLSALKGQPVMLFLSPNVVTGDSSGGQYEVAWSGTALQAKRKQVCDQNGCTWTDLSSTLPSVTADSLRTNAAWQKALQGWSQGAGGEVRIEVPSTGEFADSTPIASRTRTVVAPGAAGAPTALACVNRCPKGGLQASDFSSGSPYQNILVNNWGGGGTASQNSSNVFQPVATTNALGYTFPSSGLLTTSGAQTVDASALTLSGNYQWGLQSGRLIDTSSANYAAARCDSTSMPPYQQSNTGDSVCPWLVENVDVFYTYETGPNPWNRYIGLSSGGTAVAFDPPMEFPLVVATSNTTAATGSPQIGSTVRLQYSGFGDLHGIPGKCVEMRTNQEVACGAGGGDKVRWVPAFSIKDGAELTRNSTNYYVKYLERELRFAKVADANCTALTLPLTATLPGVPSTDPRTALGAKPTVTDAPKVVHGVVQ